MNAQRFNLLFLFAIIIGLIFQESFILAQSEGVQEAASCVIKSCSGWKLNRYPKLRKFLKGSEIGTFHNLKVEWVPGATPTAYFYDKAGQTLAQEELQDLDYDGLVPLFFNYHFTPVRREAFYADQPNDVMQFGGHRYEVYKLKNFFDKAKEFASKKVHNNEQGYMLTITCPEENSMIQNLLTRNDIDHAWLGTQDSENEGEWKWIQGPEAGTTFWSGRADGKPANGAFTNWKENEPNDVDEEDCATILVGEGKWNDASCKFEESTLIVEYGSQPLIIPSTKEEL